MREYYNITSCSTGLCGGGVDSGGLLSWEPVEIFVTRPDR